MASEPIPYSQRDMAHIESLEFQILGQIRVLADGEPIELGPFKQRALLALLIVNANRVVSTDRILEALWGEEGADKEKALWVYVSRLRSALEPDREGRGESSILVRREPGYVVTIDPSQIDARRFEELLARGRELAADDPQAAEDTLDEALAIWSGEALEEFKYEDFAAATIERLEELKLEAIESRISAALGLGNSAREVSQLQALVREHPFRERLTGQLMVALYRSGRQSEALRSFEHHKRAVGEELGIEPSPELMRLEEQILLHDPTLAAQRESTPSLAPTTVRNPYKGLRAFQKDDAADFYGRERLVAEVLRRIGGDGRLVALVGPSGSGKSSVIRAGVIPRLQKGAIDGSDEWQIATMVPGAHPYAELEIALLRSALDPPDSLAGQLDGGNDGIVRAALRVMSRDDGHLVLVIDQFEELFTLSDDADLQKRFLDGLLAAVNDPGTRITVILTLRADFYDKPLLHPAFGARLGEAVVNVTPMNSEELEEAASRPASAGNVALEASLLAQLITDVVDQPGALPMFQYTLTELFERRADSVLLAGDYVAMGGVRGAITHRADDVYNSLAPEEQEAARQLFLRLVTLSSDDALHRRRVPASEITSLDVDVVALQTAIDAFGGARLLSFDRDRRTGAPTVEVGHEALLTEWERLAAWIKGARQDLLIHASLVGAVVEWEASDRNPDYLVRGTRLAEFEKFAGTGLIDLNAHELDYLGAALERRTLEIETEEQRIAAEEQLERRAKRRLGGLVAIIAIVLGVVAIGAAVFLLSDVPTVAIIGTPPEDDPDQPGGYQALLRSGFLQAGAVHDFEGVEVRWPFTDTEQAIENVVADGTDLVVTSDFWGASTDLMNRYPETMFVILDRYARNVAGLPNEVGVTYAIEEGAFMAGAAAALVTDTGIVGYVGAGSIVDAVEPVRAGFVAGVEYVDPEIEVLTINKGAGITPEEAEQAAKEAANHLYDQGADVILEFTAGNGLGVFDAALSQSEATGIKRWVIAAGDGSDRTDFVAPEQQPLVLQSIIRKTDGLVFAAIDDFMQGTLEAGHTLKGLGDPGYEMSTGAPELAQHRIELDTIQAAVVDGTIDVPIVTANRPLMPVDFVIDGAARGTVTINEDGTCDYTYEGPEPALGVSMIFDVNNQADTVAYFGERTDAFIPGTFTIAFGVEIPQRTSTRFYYWLDDPNLPLIEMACTTDVYGPNSSSSIVATFN